MAKQQISYANNTPARTFWQAEHQVGLDDFFMYLAGREFPLIPEEVRRTMENSPRVRGEKKAGEAGFVIIEGKWGICGTRARKIGEFFISPLGNVVSGKEVGGIKFTWFPLNQLRELCKTLPAVNAGLSSGEKLNGFQLGGGGKKCAVIHASQKVGGEAWEGIEITRVNLNKGEKEDCIPGWINRTFPRDSADYRAVWEAVVEVPVKKTVAKKAAKVPAPAPKAKK